VFDSRAGRPNPVPMTPGRKRFLITVALSVGAPLIGLKLISFTGKAPVRPPKVESLPGCPASPNCVSSVDQDDHQVAALSFDGDPAGAMTRLTATLRAAGGRIEQADSGYIHATFRSRIFGFVDDVECLLQPDARQIDIRSASRSGYGDFGANRRRVERLRAAFSGNTPK